MGSDAKMIRWAVASDHLIRLHKNLFAIPGGSTYHQALARKGLSLACLTACKQYKIWVPNDHQTHLSFPRNSKTPYPQTSNTIYHRQSSVATGFLPSPAIAVSQVMRFHDAETGLIVLESAVDKKCLTPAQARALIQELPPTLQLPYRFFEPTAQSGSETRVRVFLRQLRVKVSAQVTIPGVGRADLVVGNSLIIECDSAAHHTSAHDYNVDRHRDAAARLLGYQVIRLSFAQIWVDWEETKNFIRSIIHTHAHTKQPKPIPPPISKSKK